MYCKLHKNEKDEKQLRGIIFNLLVLVLNFKKKKNFFSLSFSFEKKVFQII